MTVLDRPTRTWTQGEKTLGMASVCLAYVALELVAGSGWAFSALVGIYVAVMMFAIWCNGGLKSVFGVVILWQSIQTVLVSQIARAALGRNPETRLDAPIPTMLCEILTVLGYAAAGLIGSRIAVNRGKPLFPPPMDAKSLRLLAISATPVAVVRIISTSLLGAGSGPLHMLAAIDTVAVAAAIGYTVVESGGKRLVSPLTLPVLGPIIFFSFLSGGRGGIVLCAETVVISGWAFGYRFRPHQYLIALVGLLLMVFIISPYSLVSRARPKTGDVSRDLNSALDVLSQIVADPIKYQFDPKSIQDGIPAVLKLQDYYELPWGAAGNTLNRFGLIRPHDMIINDVLKNGTTGLANITPAFDYVLPTALNPNKGYQIFGTGNSLAHRVQGLVLADDHTTGITMGVPPDAFGAYGWPGVFLLPFAGMLFYILVQKLLINLDLRLNVFGVASALSIGLLVTEGTMSTFIQGPIYNSFLLAVAYFMTTRAVRLLDFRYLRPKPAPGPLGDGEPGVVL